jgi:transcriptional regulator with XRE-family HTH domain
LRPLEGVRELRERRMLSQQELANRAGVSLFTVQRIERGEGAVRPKTGRAVAAALGVGVEDLLPKAKAPQPSFNDVLEEQRRQWKPNVETFIAEADQALDSPHLTEDVSYRIVMDATELFLKTAEEHSSASRDTGYTYQELIDLSVAYNLIDKFNERAHMVFHNRFGESAKVRELEERKQWLRRLPEQRQGTA